MTILQNTSSLLTTLAMSCLIPIAVSRGDTIQSTYTGGGPDDNWYTAANWSTAAAPNGEGACVTIPPSSGLINVNNHAGFEEILIGANSELRLGSFGLFPGEDPIENNGTISFTPGGRIQIFEFDGAITLNGTGRLHLEQSDINPVVLGANGTNQFTIGENQTIEGYGYLGSSLETILNAGLINSNVEGKTLQSIESAIILDGGELRAESGGTLKINGSGITGQNGGTIRVGDNSTVMMSDVSITSTEIKVSDLDSDLSNNRVTVGFNMRATDSTNAARIELSDASNTQYLIIKDSFINNGEIFALDESTGSTGIIVDSNANLSGQGRVVFNDEQSHGVSGTNGADTFRHGAGHTIEGRGILGGPIAAIEEFFNEGIIHSNQGGELSIQAGRSGDIFVNEPTGTLRVSNSGMMTVPGFGTGGLTWTNRGTIDVQQNCTFDAGLNPTLGNIVPTTTKMESGHLRVNGEFETDQLQVSSGIISGGGEIRASSIVCAENVVIRPGDFVGTLAFTNNDPTFPFAACGGTFESDLSLHTDVVQLGGSTLDLDILSPTRFGSTISSTPKARSV